MAVHAHPDDEATSTGGVLAQYAAEGIRTVLVTCTDGRCGDARGGIKPGEPGHDVPTVIAVRRAELEASSAILKISDVETLDYADSGMDGWPQNTAPESFWSTPVDVAAERLAELMRKYRPDVVVTYDAFGFYGHPDHIQAHRITMAAVELTGIPAKVYWTTAPHSMMGRIGAMVNEVAADAASAAAGETPDGPVETVAETPTGPAAGSSTPDGPTFEELMAKIGLPDDQIHTWVDARPYGQQKFDAMAAYTSQSDNVPFIRLGAEKFTDLMGVEAFVRVRDTTNSPIDETDLFTGLR
jgi:LmbE family N-acetylglucosaminyl deacetylase